MTREILSAIAADPNVSPAFAKAVAPTALGDWTYRPELHLGDPAFSLFDPLGERSAVGLTLVDARIVCQSLNAHAPLLKAAKRALAVFKAQGESVRPDAVTGALDAAIRAAEGR